MYLKGPLLSHLEHIHPLTYWKEKKPLWFCLADLACKYLSIPPSSAASECLFSSAADVVSPERSRILPKKAETLLFLKKTYELLDFSWTVSQLLASYRTSGIIGKIYYRQIIGI